MKNMLVRLLPKWCQSVKTYKGDLFLSRDNIKENQKLLDNIERINGSLCIQHERSAIMNRLAIVTGGLHLCENAKLTANQLEHVGKDISLNERTLLIAKKLPKVNGSVYLEENARLIASNLSLIREFLEIGEKTEFIANKSLRVGLGISLCTQLDGDLEKGLWQNNQDNRWHISDKCSRFIRLNYGSRITYNIEGVVFGRVLFRDVLLGTLTAQEVFAIKNVEQRRIAYKWLDKSNMKKLKGHKLLEVSRKLKALD